MWWASKLHYNMTAIVKWCENTYDMETSAQIPKVSGVIDTIWMFYDEKERKLNLKNAE